MRPIRETIPLDEARELLRLFGFPFPQEAAEQAQAA